MKTLLPLAEERRRTLDRAERTIAVAEILDRRADRSSCSALPAHRPISSAARWSIPRTARAALLGIGDAEMEGMRAATEPIRPPGAANARAARRGLGPG